MRVAVIVAFVSLLTTPSEASTSCMSKTEARQHFGTVYLYWHHPEHCWDATPTRPHGVHHRVHHPESEATPLSVVPMPSPDLRRSANAMATDEPETQLITVTPWVERWTDITQRTLDRYHADSATEVHRRHRSQTRADGHAARCGDGDHNHHTNACDCRNSVRRDDQRANAQAASSRIRAMTCPK